MDKVRIGKTIYSIIERKEDEISIYYRIRKENTLKSLIHNKGRKTWELWSGRNGINEIGFPKPCQPQFLPEQKSDTALQPTQNQPKADSNEVNQLAQKLIEFLNHNNIVTSKNDEDKLVFIDRDKHQFTLDEVVKAFTKAQLKAIEKAETKLSKDKFKTNS